MARTTKPDDAMDDPEERGRVVKLRELEILELKAQRDSHESLAQEIIDALDEAVRVYVDETPYGRGPTYLAGLLGVTRGRVHQIRNRGHEKHVARLAAMKKQKKKTRGKIVRAPQKTE